MAGGDLDPDDELDDELGDVDGGAETHVSVEVSGLSLYTHHGVSDAEREVGQRLVFDLRLEVGECDATLTDRVDDTIDYGAGLRDRLPGRAAALLSHARASVRGRGRSPAGRLRRRAACGSRRPSRSPRSRWPVDEVAVELFREAL